jgi:hypothetical protein
LRNICSKFKTKSRRSAKILLQKSSDSKRPDLLSKRTKHGKTNS